MGGGLALSPLHPPMGGGSSDGGAGSLCSPTKMGGGSIDGWHGLACASFTWGVDRAEGEGRAAELAALLCAGRRLFGPGGVWIVVARRELNKWVVASDGGGGTRGEGHGCFSFLPGCCARRRASGGGSPGAHA